MINGGSITIPSPTEGAIQQQTTFPHTVTTMRILDPASTTIFFDTSLWPGIDSVYTVFQHGRDDVFGDWLTGRDWMQHPGRLFCSIGHGKAELTCTREQASSGDELPQNGQDWAALSKVHRGDKGSGPFPKKTPSPPKQQAYLRKGN
jgi:hypothetical protein